MILERLDSTAVGASFYCRSDKIGRLRQFCISVFYVIGEGRGDDSRSCRKDDVVRRQTFLCGLIRLRGARSPCSRKA